MMVTVQRVSRTELARNTRRVLSDVQRGRATLIETHGEPEAALVDIIDYRILRAVMRYYAEKPEFDVEAGLTDSALQTIDDPQDRYSMVFAHYLANSISLGRAAELLDLPWLELRARCLRLDVPLRSAPGNAEEAAADVLTAEQW